eukprot:GILI01023339.1.p1 GENE.GILI01023339.1~~GILI01023339.1.p1  ORF type:complete len:279 (+),score=43.76 GILI01023339.1:34-870(+)
MSDKPQHIVIGVDESHADSLDAIQSGLTFLSHDGHATLYSVVNKSSGTEADLKKRLEKAYKEITENHSRQNPTATPVQFHTISPFGSDTVAQSLIKEAMREKATLIAIGAGRTTSGSLGSVANEIVLRSTSAHVLICKRHIAKFEQGRGRTFLIAVDGSIASRVGLKDLIGLCKRGDIIRAVTVSDASKDLAVVEAEVGENKDLINQIGIEVRSEIIPRRNQTAAEILCEVAAEGAQELQAIVLGSSNGSSTELGSCTKWCVNKCPITVLVMKVTCIV